VEQLLKNGIESVPDAKDHKPVVRLFSSYGNVQMLLSELLPEDKNIAFGLLDRGDGKVEPAFILLSDLENMRDEKGLGIERAKFFKAEYPMSTYFGLCQSKKIGLEECLATIPQSANHNAADAQPVPRPRRDMGRAQLVVDAKSRGWGRIHVADGAERALREAGIDVRTLLERNAIGDWGDIDPEDRESNDEAAIHDGRTYSTYVISPSVSIWVITDRFPINETGVFLPDEFH